MTTTIPGIAKLVGKSADGGNIWDVDGKMLDDEQFLALIAKQAVRAESEALLDRELGEPLVGLDLQKAAEEDLHARGIHPDTADAETLLAALVRVSP